jgi:hypothetical protein
MIPPKLTGMLGNDLMIGDHKNPIGCDTHRNHLIGPLRRYAVAVAMNVD